MVVSTILAAIIGPIFGLLKKVWMILKQAWKSIKEAWNYIRNPANKTKSPQVYLLELSKIIVVGATGALGFSLSGIIEGGLSVTLPVLAIEIPLLGSIANLLGILLGAIVAGMLGALFINRIQKSLNNIRKKELQAKKIDEQNQLLVTHDVLIEARKAQVRRQEQKTFDNIENRHRESNKQTLQIQERIYQTSQASVEIF